MSGSGSRRLSSHLVNSLRSAIASENAETVALEELISRSLVPEINWQPDICLLDSGRVFLVHLLTAPQIPFYVTSTANQIKTAGAEAEIVLVARRVITEKTELTASMEMPGQYVAGDVALEALDRGFGLVFEGDDEDFYLVFEGNYQVPSACTSDEETGHIPKWLHESMAQGSNLSPYLVRLFRTFSEKYSKATRTKAVSNDKEAELLFEFAHGFAKGDPRLFMPIGQLELLRQFEASRASRKGRDHFFHTFNNLFLGYYILKEFASDHKFLAEVDRFIAESPKPQKKAKLKPKSKLLPWEVLWFLTCMFHDPAYIAEKFWGSFRFAYGVAEPEGGEDEEIPEPVKQKIRNMWQSAFVAPRRDLGDLYKRAVKRWIAPSVQPKSTTDSFDEAIEKAYFDGQRSSHSLVSGLRLINLCRSSDVPRSAAYDPDLSITACVIGALCMMFHDPRCRAILEGAGVGPIAFEHLPYASVLMFVDALQDDRRDITKCRFKKHGVLSEISVKPKCVGAKVCLAEVTPSGWPGRIAEYESVMRWINQSSDVNFRIDYKTQIRVRGQSTKSGPQGSGEVPLGSPLLNNSHC